MSTTTTPNMGMILPVPSSEPGPAWASELITALTNIIDTHDHSTGKGVKIGSAGIMLGADLPFSSFNATQLRTARFTSQSATLSGGSEVAEIYVVGGELYYNDNNGTAVKITNAGAVNVSGSNGIGGNYGGGNPAAENFVNSTGTFEFYTNPGTPTWADLKFNSLFMQGKFAATSTPLAGNVTIADGDSNFIFIVDTSATRTITLPDPTLRRRLIIIKDKSGTSETNPITLARFGTETIDGISANLTLKKNFGVWYILSDAINWWLLKTEVQDQTSVTVFDSPTSSGTDSLPVAFASPTLSAASLTTGTPVVMAANNLTFPFTGLYRVDVFLMISNIGGGTGNSNATVRLRNTTDSTTTGIAPSTFVTGTYAASFWANITDISKTFQLQWATDRGTPGTIGTNNTVVGEVTVRWKFTITKEKKTA